MCVVGCMRHSLLFFTPFRAVTKELTSTTSVIVIGHEKQLCVNSKNSQKEYGYVKSAKNFDLV